MSNLDFGQSPNVGLLWVSIRVVIKVRIHYDVEVLDLDVLSSQVYVTLCMTLGEFLKCCNVSTL